MTESEGRKPPSQSPTELLAESLRRDRHEANRLTSSLQATVFPHQQYLAAFTRTHEQFKIDLAKFAPTVLSLSDQLGSSSTLAALRTSHLALELAMPSRDLLQSFVAKAVLPAREWSALFQSIENAARPLEAATLSFQSHFARMAELSLMAQANLECLSINRIAATLRIARVDHINLNIAVSDITASYSDLLKSFSSTRLGIAAFDPLLSGLPPAEFYNAGFLGRAVSEPQNKVSSEDESIRAEIGEESEASLEQLLSSLNPELHRLWLGAKKALASSNPDRVRHCATSLRELYGHVVQSIAPDKAVESWTKDQKYFHNGRPTREARLRFICRHVDHGPFQVFVEKDVAATLAFHSLFQQGTHEVGASFTDTQLSAMVQRMDGTLRFILGLWKQGG